VRTQLACDLKKRAFWQRGLAPHQSDFVDGAGKSSEIHAPLEVKELEAPSQTKFERTSIGIENKPVHNSGPAPTKGRNGITYVRSDP
jgi:hypothetical protein